jgi:hypothetical protein
MLGKKNPGGFDAAHQPLDHLVHSLLSSRGRGDLANGSFDADRPIGLN